jgi:soluble lytic murein transglycosylase-like protein
MFRRDPEVAARRVPLVEELDRLIRRVLAVPLVAPVLALGGLQLGKAAIQTAAVDGAQPEQTHGPRIQLEALSEWMERVREKGEKTEDYVILYRDHVMPIEKVLTRRGVSRTLARQVAWPLVEHSYRRGLDPATVVSVLLVESSGRPRATSPVGARGLMQVMPAWAGHWRGCGRDLYDIEDNICNGTSILAWYLRNSGGDERKALLRYNGCVRGTNTPDCWRYPDKVQELRRQIQRELAAARRAGPSIALNTGD